jgi:hypothetical protein
MSNPATQSLIPFSVDLSQQSGEASPAVLTGKQILAVQAVLLLLRIDGEITEARSQWNQDWFRRLMRLRRFAISRLRRRWTKLEPTPAVHLGNLRRRYHANIARHLYE